MLGSIGLGLGSVGTASDEGGGGKAAVVPTLAAVYAAGAATPSVADLMAMASGTTLRFQANTDANPLPLIGLYETAASKGLTTSGYPSIGQSLATDLSLLIGGRIFNWCEMFDPNWDGTFAALSAYAWHVDTVSFQQTATTAWRRNHVFADRAYTAAKNWQPQATPAGPLGSGPGTMLHAISLYNTLDDGLETVDQLDGFGQNLRQVSPIQNGVIYETATHFSHRLVSVPAANDGVGWGVWDGDISHGGDVPRAAWQARTVGASAAGDWYWALCLQDTAGDGMLHDVATFARTGITFNEPVTFNSTSGFGLLTVVESQEIDLLTPGTYTIAPADLTRRFVPIGLSTRKMTQLTGVATAAGNVTMGNNVTFDNFLSAAAGTGNLSLNWVNSGVGGLAYTSMAAAPPLVPLVDQPFCVKVTVAPTGPTVAKARWMIVGYLVS